MRRWQPPWQGAAFLRQDRLKRRPYNGKIATPNGKLLELTVSPHRWKPQGAAPQECERQPRWGIAGEIETEGREGKVKAEW